MRDGMLSEASCAVPLTAPPRRFVPSSAVPSQKEGRSVWHSLAAEQRSSIIGPEAIWPPPAMSSMPVARPLGSLLAMGLWREYV